VRLRWVFLRPKITSFITVLTNGILVILGPVVFKTPYIGGPATSRETNIWISRSHSKRHLSYSPFRHRDST